MTKPLPRNKRPRQRSVIVCTAGMAIVICSLFGVTETDEETTSSPPDKHDVYKRVYGGWKWWHVYCYRCHGLDALGSSIAKNLRESVKVLTYEEFLTVVREGRPKKGMQAWNQLLDDKQITDVYIYVTARSQKVLPPGRPDEVGENETPWIPPDGWPSGAFPCPPPASEPEAQSSNE